MENKDNGHGIRYYVIGIVVFLLILAVSMSTADGAMGRTYNTLTTVDQVSVLVSLTNLENITGVTISAGGGLYSTIVDSDGDELAITNNMITVINNENLLEQGESIVVELARVIVVDTENDTATVDNGSLSTHEHFNATPFGLHFINGTNTSDEQLATDCSSSPCNFTITAPSDFTHFQHISMVIEDGSMKLTGEFAGLDALLTNGVKLKINRTASGMSNITLDTFNENKDFCHFRCELLAGQGASGDILWVMAHFDEVHSSQGIVLAKGDRLELEVFDDLSTIDEFHVHVFGYTEDDFYAGV